MVHIVLVIVVCISYVCTYVMHAVHFIYVCMCLPPPDIQQVTPQPTCPSSTNASELTTVPHLVVVVRGALETHHVVCSHWSCTNRQQCVPKLSMWFSVHVFMSA